MADSPPAPLRVGVTGHRTEALRGADAAQLDARVRGLLEQVAALPAAAGGPPELLSPLAEGSDRIAARAALALGYRLRALLPLPRDEYVRDFGTAASRAEFEALLTRAAATEEPAATAARDDAYRAVGHRVVAGSDLLLAIWDGAPQRGPGGTGGVVAEALARKLPVAWIDAAPPHPLRLLRSDPQRTPPWRDEPLARLEERVGERASDGATGRSA